MKLAMDRATSVRRRDADGRLHVEITNISKAAVNGYLGSEIPNGELLNLQPDRIYQLLRDPEELRKAAPTFNNLPVLSRHIPVTIHAPSKDLVIGSTGTDASFEAPYLKNSMVIWTADAINGIETRDQCEISAAYRYIVYMTPGVFEGVAYDGVMRDIAGNHVAIVDAGRAGPDVVVADQHPEHIQMAAKKLSRQGLAIKVAVTSYLLPRLAQDAKIDLLPVLKTVDGKTLKAGRPKLVADITALTTGKLAQDADVAGLASLLDVLAADPDMAGDEAEPTPPKPAEDEEVEDDDKDKVTKPAMDAAIADAVNKTRTETMDRLNAIRAAEREVRPYVGEIAVAMDSAEAIYKFALEQKKIDLTGVEPAAYKHMVRMLPDPSAPAPTRKIAQDEAVKTETEVVVRFPNIKRFQGRS